MKLLIDTYPLLFYLSCEYSKGEMNSISFTKGYEKEDFYKLQIFLNKFESIVVTPNVLTEFSNLAYKEFSKNKKDGFALFLKEVSEKIKEFNEFF